MKPFCLRRGLPLGQSGAAKSISHRLAARVCRADNIYR
jgi:hypothetical protein